MKNLFMILKMNLVRDYTLLMMKYRYVYILIYQSKILNYCK